MLPATSIANFEEMNDSFVHHFIGGRRHKRSTSYLLTVKQKEGETLREYVKRFNKALLEIDEANDQVIMTTFQAGLNHLEDSANYNDRPSVQSPEVHEWRRCINSKWSRWQVKDGRNRRAPTQKEGEEGSFPQSKEWQRKYAGSYKIGKHSRRGTCYLESLNSKQLPRRWHFQFPFIKLFSKQEWIRGPFFPTWINSVLLKDLKVLFIIQNFFWKESPSLKVQRVKPSTR